MSLILEALKKSEAQRRLGHAPGLMTPTLEAPQERRVWPFVVALVAVAVLAAATAWWFAGRTAVADDVAVVARSEPVVITPVAEPVRSEPERKPESKPAPAPRQSPPMAAAPRVEPTPRSEPAFAAQEQERESRPVPASDVPPSPFPQSEAAAPVAQTRPSAPVAVASPPDAAPEPFVPSLMHLPSAERQGLPPLRLSMHVYSADPAGRFSIIDGKRYSEGQSIAAGLVVAEIRRDGVVIERDGGSRFLLPRP